MKLSFNYDSNCIYLTDCTAMFTAGVLKADSSTMVSTSSPTNLEAYKAVVNTSMAWCSQDADAYQYLQVNLGKINNYYILSLLK